jgi:hypothetical protein
MMAQATAALLYEEYSLSRPPSLTTLATLISTGNVGDRLHDRLRVRGHLHPRQLVRAVRADRQRTRAEMRAVLDHVAGRVPVIVAATHFASNICGARSRRACLRARKRSAASSSPRSRWEQGSSAPIQGSFSGWRAPISIGSSARPPPRLKLASPSRC